MSPHTMERLPRTVVPSRYALDIRPDIAAGSFSASVSVTVEVQETVTAFVLHAAELSLDAVRLGWGDGSTVEGTVTLHPETEQVRLTWPHPVPPGPATLTVDYTGTLNDRLRGFYLARSRDGEGRPVVMAATQCQMSDARRILPCWDEPDFKAVFSVHLVVEDGVAALSNGAEVRREVLPDGKRRVTFAETMPMSSYLLALVVGPVAFRPVRWVDGVPLRIGALENELPLTAFAEEAAVHALQFFTGYFGIPYAGGKLDHVAVPDFAYGAMENLGLVIYRQTLLLVDRDTAGEEDLLRVAGGVAHETAHMWFGNLVTMRWWNGMWLNEAFASFLQHLATDHFQPSWEVWTGFGLARADALLTDATAATGPIEPPPGVADDALNTNAKGVAVLRMLEQYLGADVFRQGLRQYLERHRGGNTESHDLWAALEAASAEPVARIMDRWITEPGYPLVTATMSGRQIRLTQHPFRYDGTEESPGWVTPVMARLDRESGSREEARVLLEDTATLLAVPDEASWVVINVGATGFYRVAYDEALWARLLEHVEDLSAAERLSLASDTWALVVAGRHPVRRAVELWRRLERETSPAVWTQVAEALRFLGRAAEGSERSVVESLVQEVAQRRLQELSIEGAVAGSHRENQVRAQLMRLLGIVGRDPKVEREAVRLFQAYLEGGVTLSPTILPALAEVAASAGAATLWDRIRARVERAATPQEALLYLTALGRFRDEDGLRRTIALYFSPQVRTQDAPMLVARLLSQPEGAELVWAAVEEHWERMATRFPVQALGTVVQPVSTFIEDALAERANGWLATHPLPYFSPKRLTQLLELQTIHRRLASRLRGHLTEQLERR